MSMISFLGDPPSTVRERNRRRRSFGTRKDTNNPIATSEQIASPLVFAFNSIAETARCHVRSISGSGGAGMGNCTS